ncbi:hypothetical protein FKP32DRAFT_1605331 [Trametes sanguinea]|nr:hypothetical protein FKP32DRAFT_1605331 [Trametes sanguinea]
MTLTVFPSTPVAAKRFKTHNRAATTGDCSLANQFRFGQIQCRAAAVEDMAHKAVRLEPEEFLDHFLKRPGPLPTTNPPELESNPFDGLANAANMQESEISRLFVEAVNNDSLRLGLKMALSENRLESGDPNSLKIDASFFRPGSVPTDGKPHWADLMVAVEFKAHDTAKDPYDDRKDGVVDANAESRKQVRGQIIQYAEQIFDYQHRTSLIMLLVVGRRFRFTRWDRSGTLVTRAVDYVDEPRMLYEMLWHLCRLSDRALGLDPTAHRVLPGSHEYAQMVQARRAPVGLPDIDHEEGSLTMPPPPGAVFKYVREMFKNSLDPNFPWYRLEVPDATGTRSFLVGKRVFCAPGMAGRGTKGYVALDISVCPPRLVWLKDAWRTHYTFVAQEGAVLKELNDAEVSNVPTLICHGDIPGQATETPMWWELKNPPTPADVPVPPLFVPPELIASSSRTLVNPPGFILPKGTKRSSSDMEDGENGRDDCPLRRHKHYRLVVEEVGMKLINFQHGQQLLQIIYDCVGAHEEAVIHANIMHRDISGGNILILPKVVVDEDTGSLDIKWTGLLVDWELSKPLVGEAALPRPRQPERTGTWQFMSVAVLSDHGKLLEISDELESFFHVTLYYAVRYLRSNCPDVGSFIEDFFDTYTVEKDTYKCGRMKTQVMGDGMLRADSYATPLKFGSNLDTFFEEALVWFKAHYAVQAYQRHLNAPCTAKHDTAKGAEETPSVSQFKLRLRRKEKNKTLATNGPAPPTSASIPAPTPTQIDDAAKIRTHEAMLDALAKAMNVEGWLLDRAEGDNVSEDFKPKAPVGPPVVASTRTLKKRKVAEAQTYAGPGPNADLGSSEDPARPLPYTAP